MERFQEIFKSSNPSIPSDLEELVPHKIDLEVSKTMSYIPSSEDIWAVIKEMQPLKAPGPDGMSGSFYKSYW